MKAIVKTAGLLTIAFVILGGSAHAATFDVNVPFPFLVHGETLPAGTYRIEDHGDAILLEGAQRHQPSLFVLATPAAGRDPSGDKPALSFRRDETQYRLVDIWESGSLGLQVSR